jgi:uncharacterized protein (TIGR03118 family)
MDTKNEEAQRGELEQNGLENVKLSCRAPAFRDTPSRKDGANAIVQATTAGAVYTGVAINQAQTQLYAANTAGAGSVNVFNSSFAPAGTIATPTDISALNLVPFNVQTLSNGNLAVTYAPSGVAAQRMAAPGAGAVALFTETGALLQTILGGPLAAPWGITLAPASFGPFGGDLLIGNFSFTHSEINALSHNRDVRGHDPD